MKSEKEKERGAEKNGEESAKRKNINSGRNGKEGKRMY